MNLSSFPLIHPSIWKVKHRYLMRIKRKVYVTIILHLFPFVTTPEFQQHRIFGLTCTFCILIARFYLHEAQATLPRGRGVSYLLKWILDSLSWNQKNCICWEAGWFLMSLTHANVSRENAIICFLTGFWGLTPAGFVQRRVGVWFTEPFKVSCSRIARNAEWPATLSIILKGVFFPVVGIGTIIIDVFLNLAVFKK